MVELEVLAADFGLRTAEAIQRLQALESMGRITGLMDDRGKVGGWWGAARERNGGAMMTLDKCYSCALVQDY